MASESRIAVLAALVANFVIAVLKLVTGLAAGSSAMLAESAHSFSDVGNQILLLVGLRQSTAEPTPRYPFGQGKASYFWPFMVAVLLFAVAGAYSAFEGIEKILHPHPLGDIRLSLAVLGVAFVIESVSLGIAVREAGNAAERKGVDSVTGFLRENRDATLLTVIVEDGLALVGLPIAAAAMGLSVWTGNPVWDGIGSLVIAALLMGFAVFLGWEIKDLLLGRGLSEGDRAEVERMLGEDPAVVRVHRVQSMYMGHENVLLGAEIDLRDDIPAGEAEQEIARIEDELREALPVLRFVYLEPREGSGG